VQPNQILGFTCCLFGATCVAMTVGMQKVCQSGGWLKYKK
jgi:hypothetical protein